MERVEERWRARRVLCGNLAGTRRASDSAFAQPPRDVARQRRVPFCLPRGFIPVDVDALLGPRVRP